MLTEEQFAQILQKSRNYCSKSEKCIFDLKNYLSKYDLSVYDITKIIDILITEKFIDESRYVDFFVNDKIKFNKWGRIKIRYALKQKRIDDKLIDKAFLDIDKSNYYQILKNIIEQKLKSIKAKSDLQAKASVVRFASSRGFEYDLIMEITNEIFD